VTRRSGTSSIRPSLETAEMGVGDGERRRTREESERMSRVCLSTEWSRMRCQIHVGHRLEVNGERREGLEQLMFHEGLHRAGLRGV
jgi:hypothetical protein